MNYSSNLWKSYTNIVIRMVELDRFNNYAFSLNERFSSFSFPPEFMHFGR